MIQKMIKENRTAIDYSPVITSECVWKYSVSQLREMLLYKSIHNLRWTLDLVISESVLKRLPESTHIMIQRGVLSVNYETIKNLNNIYRKTIEYDKQIKP